MPLSNAGSHTMSHFNIQRPSPRENFLMSFIHKLTNEYKALLEYTRRTKLFKIIEIKKLSDIPGETEFIVQITNKNCALKLTAAQIISDNYNLDDFNGFHAEMIKHAAQGTLKEFLQQSYSSEPFYKIISKKFNKEIQQYIFTIQTLENKHFTRTANEIAQNKELLKNLSFSDVYDIGYTQGSESILKEKLALLLAK
jgi:hypothetical protein